MFGKLKSGTVMTSVSSTFLPYDCDFENIFVNTNHSFTSLSHVVHCVYILTKALPLFIILLKIAYVELMVGEMEACTCVIYIAKSNKGSMEMTNHTSWSKLCTYVGGGWWNAILLLWISLSFIWTTWGHGYIFFFLFFSWTLMCPFFSFFWVMLLGHAIFSLFFG